MLKLLTATLANESMQPVVYSPTATTVGLQLNYQPKGIIVDISEIDNGYSVRLFELPAGQQQPKPILKASQLFVAGEEKDLCFLIFDKYFGAEEQQRAADYAGQLLEPKKLNATKGSKL